MRKIFLIIAISMSLVGADASIEVINKGTVLPKIFVEDTTQDFPNLTLRDKFFKLLIADLKVGSSFEVVEDNNLSAEHNQAFILRYALFGNGREIGLRVLLTDATNGSIKFQNTYTQSELAKYPFLAHKSVVDIVKTLNLSPIDWMDKSILISQYTSPGQSNIIIADYTLTYQKVILSGGLNIFPKWANSEQSAFYYTTYLKSIPILFRYDIASGKKIEIIRSKGMLVASDVSKDGKKLLLSMAPQDQSDIYILDLDTKKKTRITNFAGIDVSGNFIDNDTRVVFVSDRLGYPNVFVTGIEGGAVEQMVFHGKNNNSVTTHDHYAVYSSRESSGYDSRTFNLYLISTKTDYIRQLTAGGINVYPKFSSDGGSIVFIKNAGNQSAVGIIRINENKSFQFPLRIGKIQSIDW